MAKTSGLGDNLYVGGQDISGDVGAISKISSKVALIEVTGINKSAVERIPGLRDGSVDFSGFFNKTGAHAELSLWPTVDTQVMYMRGTALGNAAACCQALQLNYDWKRDNKGGLDFSVVADADGFGIEWGTQLTAGVRTDTTATNGTGVDMGSPVGSPSGTSQTFETSIGLWETETNIAIAQTAAQAHSGTKSMSLTSVASGNMAADFGLTAANRPAVTASTSYAASAWFRSAVSARTCNLLINWYTAAQGYISTTTVASITDSTSAWTQAAGTVTSPAGAAYATVIVQVVATGGASEVHYVDDVTFGSGATAFGLQAYLQVFSFTGTSATIKLQDSPDNSTFTDVTGGSFGAQTASGSSRIQTSRALSVARYLRVATTGTFTNAAFAVVAVSNQGSVVF